MFAKQEEQFEKVASSELLLSCMKKVAQYTSRYITNGKVTERYMLQNGTC
jgi:hypothetical protein